MCETDESPRRSPTIRQHSDRPLPSAELRDRARMLRSESTPAEGLLWSVLRRKQLEAKFRRQHLLCGFIVDFVCVEYRLIVELDGGQHAEQQEYDRSRTAILEGEGFRVLRFWNQEVLGQPTAVRETIWNALHGAERPSPAPHPSPPPEAGGGNNPAGGGP